jgi:cytidylate kinase
MQKPNSEKPAKAKENEQAREEAQIDAMKKRYKPAREQSEIIAAAERQMKQWLLKEAAESASTKDQASKGLGPYVTISRESGVGGGYIARLVGENLGWEVLDKKLLDCMAKRYHLSPDMMELVDETTSNWIVETFGNWFDPNFITQQKYVICLSRIILMAANRGKAVFVGRGAQFLLPSDRGIAVRIIASEKYRVERTMQGRGLKFEEAKKYVAKTDRGRRSFIRRYFHHDVADAHSFDLVINVEKFGPHAAAVRIVEAFRAWFDEKQRL